MSSDNQGNKPRTLWIGDLEPYMDEDYVRRLFLQEGRDILSIKIIKDRASGLPAGYGFVEFSSHQSAERVLNTYGGKSIPNLPGHIYRLNWATFSVGERRPDPNPQHTVFVGDLAPEVNDYLLFTTFQARYPSVTSAKVVIDQMTGVSKGYGFVRFINDEESRRCMEEMQGAYIGSRPIKLNVAVPKRLLQQMQQQQQQHHFSGQSQSQQFGSTSNGGTNTQQSKTLTPQQIADASADPNNTTLYIGGIDETVDELELRRQFQVFGPILYVKIPQGKKCGFVCFSKKEEAERALNDMNGTLIGSNRVKISWGRTSNPPKVAPTTAVPVQASLQPSAHAGTPATASTGMLAGSQSNPSWNYGAYYAYWQQYYQQMYGSAYASSVQAASKSSSLIYNQQDFTKFDAAKENAMYIEEHSSGDVFSEIYQQQQ